MTKVPLHPFNLPNGLPTRVLILRGINIDNGAKLARPADIGPEDAARQWGFNFVRLLIVWEAVEPQKGHIDEAFLDAVAKRVDMLWAEGIHVMIDMHQDVYARRFCCDGAPEWAIRDDGEPFELQPIWWVNYLQPAVRRCFDNFWSAEGQNADLQEHFASAWAKVTFRFKDHPGVIGYDLFNEPYPGSDLDPEETLGNPHPQGPHPAFDQKKLFPAYQRFIEAIRAVDPDKWIFVEPRAFGPNTGAPSYHPPLIDPRDGPPRIAYAPHLYSVLYEALQGYDPLNDHTVENWERERGIELERQPMPLVIGEWGFDWTFPLAEEYGRSILAMADRMRAGFAYWAYGTGTWGLHNEDGSDKPWTDIVVRPYPRAVAGVPLEFGYDEELRIFRLVFEDRDGVAGPTEIYLPARRHYPGGWFLTVSDPEGTWSHTFDPDREVLSIYTPRTSNIHTVEIRPAEARPSL